MTEMPRITIQMKATEILSVNLSLSTYTSSVAIHEYELEVLISDTVVVLP